MSDEKKKKGFWSWLGFGKKEGVEQTATTEEKVAEKADAQPEEITEQAVSSEQDFAKNEEIIEENITTEDVVEVPTEVVEEVIVEPTAEEAAETTTETVEQAVVEPSAETTESSDEQTEELHISEQNPPLVEDETKQDVEDEPQAEESVQTDEYQEKPTSEGGFFSRLIKGLIKTKQSIGSGFRNFFSGKKIDDELFEELEEQLLVADLGMPTTTKIIKNLTEHATKQQLRDAELLYQQLKVELADVLKPVAQPLVLEDKKPYVILMVGVNGVGKTTTIGKLARKFQAEGKSVMLAAGDTFRAAAVEQLQVWGERNHIPVVAQSTGADSASVIFDAMQSAAAKGIDVLIADTAGRLQNKNNLMDELKKIVRVMKKYDETAPHEIMLTLDAGTGQNAISQAKLFNEAVGLTGITLTKLDGTAKGGVIFAIADQFNIPIRFIGVGEKIDDLRSFDAEEFIEALFTHEDEK
ncbi:signal recognition particle-docking protein FtsY [Glaesserella parasuis]|uniref:signal recognition particle-docking protein FtsY n=1 Tax=Glaesserella parasuis TaxID=738 RepID=UPI0023684B43|nr:signal recognition particle-docking protein FtsY [Glaesserella parasuis]MDG6260098.1 signal recognition particle-docking protein FtsY [Glaesserella parasuis]MDG6270686.1 signal recognition particle-docking protein FtsY [Glaesserella parasuis]MDG6479014.1 signal recognition particle-docking protein FtsY [Glaesserella parasuis]MDO9677043.1 signal recognition particle-docking protein FtsY [Glaesserella parasuis]MDO9692924.1 signal recognition particle-docking protein FtsY [Glaesserella parasui